MESWPGNSRNIVTTWASTRNPLPMFGWTEHLMIKESSGIPSIGRNSRYEILKTYTIWMVLIMMEMFLKKSLIQHLFIIQARIK